MKILATDINKIKAPTFYAKINKLTPIFLLIMIIGVGAFLRFYKLSAWGMWEDEYLTETRAHLGIHELFSDNWKIAPMLIFYSIYTFYGWIVELMFGITKLDAHLLRIPSAVFGVLGIIAIYHLGRIMVNRWVGLYCAFITTFHYYHIYYSREARFYAIYFFFSTIFIYCFWKCNVKEYHKLPTREYIIYAIIGIMGIGIHQGFLMLFAVLNLYLAILEIGKGLYAIKYKSTKIDYVIKRWITVGAGLLIPLIVWSPAFIILLNYAATKAESSEVILTYPTFNMGLAMNIHKDFWINVLPNEYIILILVVAFLVVISSKYFLIAILWILASIIPIYILSHMPYFHIFRTKYLFFLLTLSILLIGSSFNRLVELTEKLFQKLQISESKQR
jgi:hypothetical protein